MLKLNMKVPRRVVVAVSGGPDSMAALDFLRRNHTVLALHVNHGTDGSKAYEELLINYCRRHFVPLEVRELRSAFVLPGMSKEAYWSRCRREIYDTQEDPVVVAHHLNDAVEWWVHSAMRGKPRLLAPMSGSVIRPFLETEKSELTRWCEDKEVPFIIDPTNVGDYNDRARLRDGPLDDLKKIYPGLNTTVRNMLMRARRGEYRD